MNVLLGCIMCHVPLLGGNHPAETGLVAIVRSRSSHRVPILIDVPSLTKPGPNVNASFPAANPSSTIVKSGFQGKFRMRVSSSCVPVYWTKRTSGGQVTYRDDLLQRDDILAIEENSWVRHAFIQEIMKNVTSTKDITFPRPRDNERFAWGLAGPEPAEIWERFSPSYEAQLERLILALGELGFVPTIGGSGSEDGEYVRAEYTGDSSIVFFYHLEDPADARFIASLDEKSLHDWITESWITG